MTKCNTYQSVQALAVLCERLMRETFQFNGSPSQCKMLQKHVGVMADMFVYIVCVLDCAGTSMLLVQYMLYTSPKYINMINVFKTKIYTCNHNRIE